MPSHATHRKITRAILGEDYDWVHKFLDVGVQQLGPHHRDVTHNQRMVALTFLKSGGDVKALLAAELHIITDREFSEAQRALNRLLKKYKGSMP